MQEDWLALIRREAIELQGHQSTRDSLITRACLGGVTESDIAEAAGLAVGDVHIIFLAASTREARRQAAHSASAARIRIRRTLVNGKRGSGYKWFVWCPECRWPGSSPVWTQAVELAVEHAERHQRLTAGRV